MCRKTDKTIEGVNKNVWKMDISTCVVDVVDTDQHCLGLLMTCPRFGRTVLNTVSQTRRGEREREADIVSNLLLSIFIQTENTIRADIIMVQTEN